MLVALVAWAIVSTQLIFFAVFQPIYSPIDEFNHFFYINYLYYQHRPPALGLGYQGTLDPSVPVDRSIPPSRGRGVPMNPTEPATEGIQPPGYYALMMPVFALSRHGTYDQITHVRLATAALATLLVPLTFLLARLVVPGAPWVWGAAPVLTALSRGYTFNLSQVTNDSLAVVVGSGAVLVFLWLLRAPLNWRWGLVAGVTAGLATITKVTVYYVPIFFALTFVVRAVAERRRSQWLSAAVVGSLVSAAIAIPWFALNIRRYHGLAPKTDFAHLPEVLIPYHNLPLWRSLQLMLELGSLKFWVGEVAAAPPPLWLLSVGEVGLLVCLLGFLKPRLWRNGLLTPIQLVGAWAVGGLCFLTGLVLWTQVAILTGRYVYPLFAPIAVTVAAGAASLGRPGKWVFAGAACVLAVATAISVSTALSWVSGDCRC